MKKKIISSVLALSLILGGAAVLPENTSFADTSIVAAAKDIDYGMYENQGDTFQSGDYKCCKYTDGTVGIIGQNDKKTHLDIPEKINGKKVVYVSLGGEKLKSLSLPKTVSLAYINLEKGVKSVDKDNKYMTAKDGILYSKDMTTLLAVPRSLKKYTFPKTITTIGENAFFMRTVTKDIVFQEGLKKVDNIAFYAATIEKGFRLPDGVTTIGDGAFYNAGVTEDFTLPDSVEVLGDNVFSAAGEITSPTSFKVPASVTEIGGLCFVGWHGLKKITLPDGLKKIKEDAFWSLPLKNVVIPNTVTSIESRAFFCQQMKSIVVPPSVKTIKEGAIVSFDKNCVVITTKGSAADKYVKEYNKDKNTVVPLKVRYDKTVALCDVTVKDKVYTGKSITPEPTVKFNGKTLKKDKDYTLSYKNNKKVGRATLTIKGKGKYSGTLVKSFNIIPKKSSVNKLTSTAAKKLKAKLKKLAGATSYEITYSTSKKFTAKTTKTANTTKLTKTISKLKSGKTYYVKVRAVKTVKGIDYKSKYSAVKKIKVK